MNNTSIGCLRLTHVNIRGIRANLYNLGHYLARENYPDVVTLNETKLGISTDLSCTAFPNYIIAARREPSQNGGIHGSMILVRNNLSDVTEIDDFRLFSEEVIGVKIRTCDNHSFNIVTYYNPPGIHINDRIFSKCRQLKGKTIIAGDLNCKSLYWGSTLTDIHGERLLDALIDNQFHVLNNGEKTRYNPVSGNEQSLDIIACDNDSRKYFSKFYIGDDVGSDHFPLNARFEFGFHHESNVYRNIKDTDWEMFKSELDTFQLDEPKTGNEIDAFVTKLTNAIMKAFEHACPAKRRPVAKGMTFSDDMINIVKEKRALRRQKSRAIRNSDSDAIMQIQRELNRKNYELKKLQKQKMKEDLRRECATLNKEKDPRKFFLIYDKITGRKNVSESNSKVITDENGIKAETDQEKAEVFVNHLENTHKLSDFSGFNEQWRENVEMYVSDRPNTFTIDKNHLYEENESGDDGETQVQISLDDVKNQLQRCKNKSAPGEDGINYLILKRVPKNILKLIVTLFRSAYKIGYFPEQWKRASIKMIPKPGKDDRIVKNFRPISLLPCLGKIFERIIAQRLSSFLESKNLFSKYQAGYRKGRMTTEHILRLSEETCSSFKRKQVSMSLFLDAEAAFDKAWHDAIRYKLHHVLKLPNRLVRLISSFLTDRKLTVCVGKHKSKTITMRAGTPQGSALSPILYLILVNDVPDSIEKYSSFSQFADDMGMWTQGYSFHGTRQKLQKAINELESWCRKWRIKLNGSKSQLMVSSKLHEKPPDDMAIQLFNDNVKPEKNAKFLGVTYDENFSMKDHVDTVIQKSMKRLGVFKLLSFGGVSNEVLVQLYKTFVRPLFEYGSVSLIHIPKQIQRMQKVQNIFIRTSLKIPSYLSTNLIHQAAGLEKIDERLRKLNKTLLTKMTKSETVQGLRSDFESIVPLNNYKSPLDVLSM